MCCFIRSDTDQFSSDALETNMRNYQKHNLYAFLMPLKGFRSSSSLADKSAKLGEKLRVTKISKKRLESL